MASAMFGLELLKKTVENSIKNESDRIVVVIHWVLLEDGFKCLGVGDSKTLAENENTSELLPDDWNAESPKSYNLRYVKGGKLYLAKITQSGDDILFDLISTTDLKVKSVVIPSQDVKSIDEKKIIEKVSKETVRDSSSEKKKEAFVPRPPCPLVDPFYTQPQPRIFPEIGRSDLDPFAPGPVSGMIFPMPNLGPPTRPYRFDPINPLFPEPRRGGPRTDPDPDDFFPPGGNFYM